MKRLPQIPRPHQQWLFDPDGAEVMGFYPTRRLRIICLMCQDTDTADIATELNISMPSLLCYRAAILEKAGVKTHTGLVFWAVKEGLVRKEGGLLAKFYLDQYKNEQKNTNINESI